MLHRACKILGRSTTAVTSPQSAESRSHPGGGGDLATELDRAAAVRIVASTTPAPGARDTLARIGARAMGAALGSPDERGLGGADQAEAIAQRLPVALGTVLLVAAGLAPGGD